MRKILLTIAALAAVLVTSLPAAATDFEENKQLSICDDAGRQAGVKLFNRNNQQTSTNYYGGAVICTDAYEYGYASDYYLEANDPDKGWLDDIWNGADEARSGRLRVFDWYGFNGLCFQAQVQVFSGNSYTGTNLTGLPLPTLYWPNTTLDFDLDPDNEANSIHVTFLDCGH